LNDEVVEMMIRKLVLAAAFFLCAGAVVANEGRLVFVDGAVRLVRPNAAPVEARLGDSVGSGATIVTGLGRAHLKFPDGALVSLQPNTTFVMSTYVYNGQNDGAEQFAGSLIKGGLRMVTGLIGRRDNRAVRVQAVVATVGIRGTAFKMEYCNQDCGGRRDGLYVDGGEGTTVVSNAAGSIDLTRGSSAFVASQQSAPERSSQRTTVSAPAPRSPAQIVGAVREEQRFADYSFKSGGLEGPFRAINVTQAGSALAGIDQVAGSGSIGGGSTIASSNERFFVALDARDRVFAVGGNNGFNGGSFFLTTSNVENAGSDGLLYWGRWANGQVQVNFNFPGDGTSGAGTRDFAGAQSVHYIVSQQVSAIPMSGSASYSFFAGTPSTSNDGAIGAGVTAGSLSVNFGSNSGSLSMSLGHGGVVLNQNGGFSLNGANRAAFNGSGSGSYPFTFEGFFGGGNRADANPARAGLSYLIQRPGNFITGVAGFK